MSETGESEGGKAKVGEVDATDLVTPGLSWVDARLSDLALEVALGRHRRSQVRLAWSGVGHALLAATGLTVAWWMVFGWLYLG